MEHFFRFGKQKLNLADFQTSEVKREEKWWQLAHIAYAQLWMARHVAFAFPRPWERNLPRMKLHLMSPALVHATLHALFARLRRERFSAERWGHQLNHPNPVVFRPDGARA